MLTRQNPMGLRYMLSVHHDGETTNKTRISLAGTGKFIVVDCPLEEVSERWFNWQMKGQFIQDAFNNLNADEREFLMTGMTSEEWNAAFGESDDVESSGDVEKK